MCLEPLTKDQFRFPCGHGVCTGCNGRLSQRNFLSCPTCRTPREGVSQRQVDSANHARARDDRDSEHQLVVFAGGREYQVLFFPDESDGQHPFAPLEGPPGTLHEVRPPRTASEQAEQAEHETALQVAEALLDAYEEDREVLGRRGSRRLTIQGPMRDLVNALTQPTSVEQFLAHRDRVLGPGAARAV